jgi:hypothetical protein
MINLSLSLSRYVAIGVGSEGVSRSCFLQVLFTSPVFSPPKDVGIYGNLVFI